MQYIFSDIKFSFDNDLAQLFQSFSCTGIFGQNVVRIRTNAVFQKIK